MKKNTLLIALLALWQLAAYGRGTPSMDHQPLSFIENKGQIRDQYGNLRTDIDFILQTQYMVLYIGKGQLHYQFSQKQPEDTTKYTPENPPKRYHAWSGYTTYRLDVSLAGANVAAEALKEGPQTAKYHYYNTGAPDGVTGVQSYSRITYKDIYPGIDWVLYTKDNKLKYDFVVHSGAKLSDIRLSYSGASAMSVAKDGSLQITMPLGDLEEEAPYSYEQGTKKMITSRYLLKDNTVSLQAGAYKGTLVIDPTVDWATYFGGESDESPGGIVCDSLGYIYIGGTTFSLSGVATAGAYQDTLAGYCDAYLAKFDSLGQLQWATYYGGNGSILGAVLQGDIALDHYGHLYATGVTTSEDGIATPGSYQDSLDPDPYNFLPSRIYLAQFNTEGLRQWGTYYGAAPASILLVPAGCHVTCDRDGNVYFTGVTDTTASINNQLVSVNAFQGNIGGASDALLVKFDSSGNRLWATYYGGENIEQPTAVSCDDSGNIYMGGITYSTSTALASVNGYQATPPLSNGGFVVKFAPNGDRVWGTYIDGEVMDLDLDRYNHLYIAGLLWDGSIGTDTSIVTPGCWQNSTVAGNMPSFLMSFNPVSCTRNWGTYYCGDRTADIYSVTSDYLGNVYFAGFTSSSDPSGIGYIATPESYQDTFGSDPLGQDWNGDAFIVQFDSTGMRKWGSYYGGPGDENMNQTFLACDPTGAIYLYSGTNSTSGIATPGSYQDVFNGTTDAFLVRWLPVDIGMELDNPRSDTVCTGDMALDVLVTNHGRVDKTDDLVITYSYFGPSEGGDTLTFTGGLAAGASATYALGPVSLPYEGTYDFTVYLHYTQDDNERNNDTLHFSLTTTTAEPVANIEYSQIGTNYQFSDPDGLSSYTYHWDFGDGDTSSEATPTHSYAVSGTYDVTLIVTGWCGSDTAHLSLDAVGTGTGMSGISGDNLLSVYPNPAKGDLYLKAAGLTMKRYEVVNALGQTMLNGTLNGQQDKINVSSLAVGAYYIRIDTNKGMAEKPFQVIR